jgi:ADP-ribosyltransferase exoenzyme
MKLSGMVQVGSHILSDAQIEFSDLAEQVDEFFLSPANTDPTPAFVASLVAAVFAGGNYPEPLGNPQAVTAAMIGWIHQDDEAHEACSLTACLNPLHPGPCKGWKGNLFKVAPNAFHALEAARVEKANASRVKKIEALKQAGKPIPKKLLTPIVAKPHPHAGKTANAATGEAHAAGKAVSESSGVHVSEPGKMTLGQAVKAIKATDATTEKGAKGKKPTVASKGIAAVIAQEKVTPQYKLDKAAKITPEQWGALSHDEKAIIRGELGKIKNEGFGPQQKKATELLEGPLADKPTVKAKTTKPGAPEPTKLSQIATPKTALAESKPKPEGGTKAPEPSGNVKEGVEKPAHGPVKSLDDIKVGYSWTDKDGHKYVITETPAEGKIKGFRMTSTKHGGAEVLASKAQLANDLGLPVPAHEPPTLAKATAGSKLTEPTSMTPLSLTKIINKEGAADVMLGGKKITVSYEGAHEGTLTFVTPLGKGGGHYVVTTKDGEKYHLGKGELIKVIPQAAETTPTPAAPLPKAETPKLVPAHVQHAIDMATGKALGTGLSKNHLDAYQKLSTEEFQGLPKDVQDKIVQELHKGLTKFLDPKKIDATHKLIDQFGAAKSAAKAPTPPKIENVSFFGNLHDHQVTPAQAKTAVVATPMNVHFAVAKNTAGLESADSPDDPMHAALAAAAAKDLVDQKQKIYSDAVKEAPGVQTAAAHLVEVARSKYLAQEVAHAKSAAYKKISLTLAKDDGKLSPIEKASLQHYQKYLVAHPVKTDTTHMDKLNADFKAAEDSLTQQLHAAMKAASAPKPADMTSAQIKSKTGELLGPEAINPHVNLTMAELKDANASAVDKVAQFATMYTPEVLSQPEVAAKAKAFEQALGQLEATTKNQAKLKDHLAEHHQVAINTSETPNGTPLSTADKDIIALHAAQLQAEHAYLQNVVKEQQAKVLAAMTAFTDAANAAKNGPAAPAPPAAALTDFDKATIQDAYSNAWSKHASKAVTFGVNSYSLTQEMKAHPEYAPLTQDLGNLRAQAGKLALANAELHTAALNVPFDPDTGAKLPGPEKDAWMKATIAKGLAEDEFTKLHKIAQARLDKIRTDVGLKKRALPKANAAPVLAAAAETGYYKSGGYSGPNYGKPAKAKNYMIAKVGTQHAVKHQSAAEKKADKLATQAAKIENVPGKPPEPVKLGGGDSSIAHIPTALKKQITSDFKGMPSGKYLADPAQDVFGNAVNLAAAHGKNLPDGLSVDQVLKTIDETHSKNMGFENTGLMHAKVMDWLGTPEGKQYAETHSTPNPKVVKQITGEVTLPEGVTLAPGEKVQPLAGPGPHDTSIPAASFKAHTSPEAQAEQDAYKKAQGITWSSDQKKAMTAYTGNGPAAYDGINNYLRGKGGYDQVVKQYAVDIQSAMMPLREHTLLKRGTGFSGLPFTAETALQMVGKTFEDAGFTSSSVAGSGGHFSGKPLQLVIEAPKGTPAVFVNGISKYKNSENEMLLAAGTKFKILSVEKTSGGHILMRVRVVGEQ